MLCPQIIEKLTFAVVGFEGSFIHALSPDANNLKVIGELWEKLGERVDEIEIRSGEEMFGIIHGGPKHEHSHPHELQYVAGVPVSLDSSKRDIPNGMICHRVSRGLFAVFSHRGAISGIGETVGEIYREWLPQSEYEHAQICDVELYDQRFNCETESESEYWISVKIRGSTAVES